MLNQILTHKEFIIFISFTSIIFVHQIWYWIYTIVIVNHKQTVGVFDKPLSVIICAKNEYDNLTLFIPKICTQDYPNYEVIVVNDASLDDSDILLTNLERKYPNLRHTNIPYNEKFEHGKKLALTIGVKSAKNDYFVLIDADCYPTSSNWLTLMSKEFINKQIVLGYGGYEKKKSFLNKLIRFETIFIANQYFALTKLGMPYMGVGRNIAYTKNMFWSVNGFVKHAQILSGDDDLFINEVSKKENTTININPKSFTISVPQKKWREYLFQKQRHLSTGTKYKLKHKLVLGIEWLLRLLYYLALAFALCNIENYVYLVLLLMSFIIDGIRWEITQKQFKEKGLILFFPIFEILITVLPLALLIKSYANRKQSKWI